MQQNNYIEAEDAYRRALSIAPDNNKMCNLGICLMKQGRIVEAKENLRRVKPAVADGPRGIDSHLKAYERAQQMLKDLESEMMNKCGADRVEQSRLFDAFLGSSSIWQPQPCKDSITLPPPTATRSTNPIKIQDDFPDENANSNIMANKINLPQQKILKQQSLPHPMGLNSWNIDAPPFYSSKFTREPVAKNPMGNQNLHETLKRTRSGNAANFPKPVTAEVEKPESKTRRRLSLVSEEAGDNKLVELLPDSKDFEDAILAAVLGENEGGKSTDENRSTKTGNLLQRKVDKRLKVFQDITLSLSPRA